MKKYVIKRFYKSEEKLDGVKILKSDYLSKDGKSFTTHKSQRMKFNDVLDVMRYISELPKVQGEVDYVKVAINVRS